MGTREGIRSFRFEYGNKTEALKALLNALKIKPGDAKAQALLKRAQEK